MNSNNNYNSNNDDKVVEDELSTSVCLFCRKICLSLKQPIEVFWRVMVSYHLCNSYFDTLPDKENVPFLFVAAAVHLYSQFSGSPLAIRFVRYLCFFPSHISESAVMNAHQLLVHFPEEENHSRKYLNNMEKNLQWMAELLARKLDFYVIRPTPYPFLLVYGEQFNVVSSVVKGAWKLLYETTETDICVKHDVHVLAAAALNVVASEQSVEVKSKIEGKPWYCVCDMRRASLEEAEDALLKLKKSRA